MYYPKNRIIQKQNSLPGELNDPSGNEFTGEYFMTYDGNYFSGNYPPNSTTKKLSKIEFDNNFKIVKTAVNSKYQSINPEMNIIDLLDPTPYYPKPTNSEYSQKFIIRYFAKQREIRTFKLIEISKEVYDDIVGRKGKYNYSGWDVVSLFWQISGPLYDINIGGIPSKAGVIDTNKRIINIKNKQFIGLDNYLTDFQEFYKE